MVQTHGVPAFHKNPYIVAMLLHGIAKGNLIVNKEEEMQRNHNPLNINSSAEESKQSFRFTLDQWEQYFAPNKKLNPELKWGEFLPQRVRKLLLNLSRYNF